MKIKLKISMGAQNFYLFVIFSTVCNWKKKKSRVLIWFGSGDETAVEWMSGQVNVPWERCWRTVDGGRRTARGYLPFFNNLFARHNAKGPRDRRILTAHRSAGNTALCNIALPPLLNALSDNNNSTFCILITTSYLLAFNKAALTSDARAQRASTIFRSTSIRSSSRLPAG